MWAVVPLKSPDAAKSRLAPLLDAKRRRRLYFSMARHVLRTLGAAPSVTRVAVITASDEVERFAQKLGVGTIRQSEDLGTAHAFAAAVENLRPFRLPRLLMISGDLPLLSTSAVQCLLDAAHRSPGIVVAPDRRRIGTNALLCTPPEVIPPAFGADSFHRHLALAQTRGIPVDVVFEEQLALDLDIAADLAYLRCLRRTHPRRSLVSPARLAAPFMRLESQ